VWGWRRLAPNRRAAGFTLIELVVTLAILGILISLALPRYLSATKRAYKSEADNILQETKSLEWAYYQQYNSFDTTATGASLNLLLPPTMHWNAPSISGTATSIQITMSGSVPPLSSADSVWIILSADGSSGGGASF
jgi:prepilin-type N-terminal cleavage/methylation domain-containing protein